MLLVCTETYNRRVNLDEEPGKGHGVLWEGRLIKQQLYDSGSVSGKFVPILFKDGNIEHIPEPVRGASFFRIDTPEGYEALYRLLTRQPAVRRPELGKLRPMPERRPRSQTELPSNETEQQERSAERPGEHRTATISHLPIGVPRYFLGREDVLADMDLILRQHEGRVAITALHGLRGVGKTTLAAAYAERHRGEYRATWWIRSETEPAMRADLVALGVRLGWAAVTTRRSRRSPRDGAAAARGRGHPADLRQCGRCRCAQALSAARRRQRTILVTSNAHAWRGVAAPVEIRLWPKEIGADYLVARTGRTGERDAAVELSEALGGLPLAHEQAAAYCERLDLSLARVLASVSTNAPARHARRCRARCAGTSITTA